MLQSSEDWVKNTSARCVWEIIYLPAEVSCKRGLNVGTKYIGAR